MGNPTSLPLLTSKEGPSAPTLLTIPFLQELWLGKVHLVKNSLCFLMLVGLDHPENHKVSPRSRTTVGSSLQQTDFLEAEAWLAGPRFSALAPGTWGKLSGSP